MGKHCEGQLHPRGNYASYYMTKEQRKKNPFSSHIYFGAIHSILSLVCILYDSVILRTMETFGKVISNPPP